MLKYKVNFYLYKESKTQPGEFSIRAYVSYAGKRPFLYTGVYVPKSDWSKDLQRSKNKRSFVNGELNEIESIIEDIFKDYDYHERCYPTPTQLKETFTNRYKRRIPVDYEEDVLLQDKYAEFISESSVKLQWSDNTIKKHNKIKNHLFFYKPDLDIGKLTENDLIGFIIYFQNEPKIFLKNGTVRIQAPHKNTSVEKLISDFKTFLKWAAKKKYYEGDLHEEFKPKFKGTAVGLNEIIYFNTEKLMKFYNHEFLENQQHLERVRDVIAFCCFSSLRFSDVQKLKRVHISKNAFKTVTKKTVDNLNINLNNYSRAILDKYQDEEFEGGLALPAISNQNTNEYLKEIGRILQFNDMITTTYYIGNERFEETEPFWKHMSTHMGRRTFVVVSLYLGIPETVIMKFTGHKDYKAMKPYIAIMEGQKPAEMSKFNFIEE